MLAESKRRLPDEFKVVQANKRSLRKSGGQRLREAREKCSLTREDLAIRANIDVERLSAIESEKAEPTLGTLWRLAVSLGVPFSELIGADDNRVSIQRAVDAQVLRANDGVLESRPLVTSGFSRWVETYALTLSAGGRYESDAHAQGTREIVVVVSGVLQVEIDGHAHTLGPGDSISFLADSPHAYVNPGHVPGHYHDIIVYDR